jgi:YVTN family beta-propeller protein
MKKYIIVSVGILALIAAAAIFVSPPEVSEKVYVAVEGEGKIVAFDAQSRTVVAKHDLSREHEGGKLPYMPHNVQVAPDGGSVWATASAGSHEGHSSRLVPVAFADEGHGGAGEEADEVIVINPHLDTIVRRIPIAKGLHLAHVVLTPDSRFAYVSAQVEGAIYKVDAKSFEIVKKIPTRAGSEPHGMRIAPDGSAAYIAMLKGKSLGVLDLQTDALREVPLGGAAVQAGITPDGKYAFASLYDTKQLAIYDISAQSVRYADLPAQAKGPVQVYPTPDSRFVYVADQGHYFGQPANDRMYKVELLSGKVAQDITAGNAPHGVVVSKDGKFVYVTNLLGGDVSVVDVSLESEVARVPVGKEPNGISVWNRETGGTP